MEKVHTIGVMEPRTAVIGRTTRWTGRDCIPGKMVGRTKEATFAGRNRDTEFTNGPTEEYIRVVGETEPNMGKGQ